MSVTLELDKSRTLKYTWKAIKRLKKEQGIGLLGLEEQDFFDPEVISGILWAGLIDEDPELTVDEVDDLIEFGRFAEIGQAIAAAIQEATVTANPTRTATKPKRSRGRAATPRIA